MEPGDFEGRAVYLESNPIVWLAARGGTRQTLLLTVVGITALIGLTAWLLSAGATAVGFTLFGLMFLIHLTISVSVASEACHLFSGARESGAMELLLCTPMTAKEVVEGHVLGLRKMFYKPVAALVTIEAVLVAGQVYVLGGSGYSLAGCILILMLSGLCILGVVMDLAAVARYGLWQGLVNRKPAKAVTRTVLWVLLVPLIPVLCSAGFLLPLIWPLKNLMFINYAREVDGGLQTVKLKMPAIVTTDLRLNEPRYASLPNIMKAKKKPIEEKTPDAYGVDVKPRLEVLKTAEPAGRKSGVKVGSVAELVGKLKDAGAI